eukprot:361051-Chlamydomonas_euryale.AAC.3
MCPNTSSSHGSQSIYIGGTGANADGVNADKRMLLRRCLLNASYPYDIIWTACLTCPSTRAQFKMVTATSLDKLVTGAEYTEELSDYPYAVEGWEHMQAARLGLKPEELPRRPADAGIEFAPGTAYVYLLER